MKRLFYIILIISVNLYGNSPSKSRCVDSLGLIPEYQPSSGIVLAPSSNSLSASVQLLKTLPRDTQVFLYSSAVNSVDLERLLRLHPGSVKMDGELPNNWTRDSMPQVVQRADGTAELVQFKYSWRESMSEAESNRLTKLAGEKLAKQLGLPLRYVDLEIQGGAYFSDEQGRLYITTAMYNDFNRVMSRTDFEEKLRKALSVKSVHWFEPMPDEGTGHIDIFAKAVAPGKVMVSDSRDPDRKRFLDGVARRFQNEFGFEVFRVMNAQDQKRRSWTYTNSLVFNGNVYIPAYSEKEQSGRFGGTRPATQVAEDGKAVEAYLEAGFPIENIFQISSATMITQGGAVHCTTCQINKPTLGGSKPIVIDPEPTRPKPGKIVTVHGFGGKTYKTVLAPD